MLPLISDPKLYLLFLAAYAVGFIESDEQGDDRWAIFADAAFWLGIVLLMMLVFAHGALGIVIGCPAAWILAIVGARRSHLVQRNSLWETPLWTASFEALLAAAHAPQPRVRFNESSQPRRSRTPVRTLPSLADLLAAPSRRQTVFGMALDMAACFSVITVVTLLLHLGS